jgi:hypothetical protein
MGDFPVRVDVPAGVSLFAYDNHTFVVQSWLDKPASVTANLPEGTVRSLYVFGEAAQLWGVPLLSQGA